MTQDEFEQVLSRVATQLTNQMRESPDSPYFSKALDYEQHVRQLMHDEIAARGDADSEVDLNPSGQTFPDIPVGEFGVEVKFTCSDTWVSIANSIRESQRVQSVTSIYVMFGKMGESKGSPAETRWKPYESCVVHVRTSHEPRFQVDLSGNGESLFTKMGISYDEFRQLDIMGKMPYIRKYARQRHPDGRLWWLEDSNSGEEHSTPVEAVLYTSLPTATKTRLRAEATLLSPKVLGRQRDKYKDVVLFILTYHGVLCHQVRDLFTAGSVTGAPQSDGSGEQRVQRALILLEPDMIKAARSLDEGLFQEYWGVVPPVDERIGWWLDQADRYAHDWTPSDVLFLDYQRSHKKKSS